MNGAAAFDELQRVTIERSSRATAESLDRPMSGAGIARFLADRTYAAVATTRPDKRPHLAMTGFLANGATMWLPVMAGTVRAANIRSLAYASVVVADGEGDEHTMVTLEGPASVVDERPHEVQDEWQARFGSPPEWADAWIRVEAARLRSFAAVRSPYAD